jgi:hypothetical protein
MSLEVPPANGQVARLDEFDGKLTLAADSPRFQWNGVAADASRLDLQVPAFS